MTPAEFFVAGLQEVLGTPEPLVALHEPELDGNEWVYVKECIDSGWVSSVGKFVDAFEQRLAEATGTRHAAAMVNGTAALHIALLAAGVRRDDEVLVPALSFVATANAVAHCGAVPHFVDSNADTLSVDAGALAARLETIAERSAGGWRNAETGRRLAAILPMHTFGHMADMQAILEVAARYGLPVVEDAAESLGSMRDGRYAGSFGTMGVLSFNGNKVVTTGGGGAVVTDDRELWQRLKHLSTTGKQPHRWQYFHDMVAFNYRMPNINAALGCAQLERLEDFLARKRRLAERYQRAFAGAPGFEAVREPAGCRSNYWLNAVRLATPDFEQRDALLEAANDAGYQCRPVWTLLHKLPMYQSCPRAGMPVAERLEASLINIPSSAKLSAEPHERTA